MMTWRLTGQWNHYTICGFLDFHGLNNYTLVYMLDAPQMTVCSG